MRKKIVAGNWKMNLFIEEGKTLVNDIISQLPSLTENEHVILCCPFTHLDSVSDIVKESMNTSVHFL